MQKRTYKPRSVTMPDDEYEAALKKLPYGANKEVETFSALVRLALKLLPKK